MVISRQDNHGEYLEVENYKSEKVYKFKYLSVEINYKKNYEEIRIWIAAAISGITDYQISSN